MSPRDRIFPDQTRRAIDTGAVARWLAEGAPPATQPGEVLAQFCERLVAAGIPLWRTAIFVRTLHPAVMGRRLMWRPDTGVEMSEAGFERLEDDDYLASPVTHVYGTRRPLRRRLAAAECPADFPILAEFLRRGRHRLPGDAALLHQR